MLKEAKFLALHKGIHAARPDGEIALKASDARDMLAALAATGNNVLIALPTPFAREWINKIAKHREQAALAAEAQADQVEDGGLPAPDPNNLVG